MSVRMEGTDALVKAFMRLPDSLMRTVERKCVKPATKILDSAIRANMTKGVGVDEGLTRQSVGVRIRTYTKSGVVLGIVGPRRGERWRGKRPTNIVWLLEHGHRIVVGGTARRTDEKKAQGSRKGKEYTGKGRVVGQTRAFHMVQRAFDSASASAQSAIDAAFPSAVDEAVREASRG